MSLALSFSVPHINTVLLKFCPLKVTAAVSCLTWYTSSRWTDTKMITRVVRLMSDATLWCQRCERQCPRNRGGGGLNRLAPQQQLGQPPFSSPAGIPTMSAVTSSRNNQQRLQNAAQRKQRRGEEGGQERWGVDRTADTEMKTQKRQAVGRPEERRWEKRWLAGKSAAVEK